MRNPHRLAGWEIAVLLFGTLLMCLTMNNNDQDQTASAPYGDTAVQP